MHVLVLALLAGACTSTLPFTNTPLKPYDSNTKFAIDDFDGGFQITVDYTKYMFISEMDAMNEVGVSKLIHIAEKEALKIGKKIEPIDATKIVKSLGRNGLTGVTSWSGTAKVMYTTEQNQ